MYMKNESNVPANTTQTRTQPRFADPAEREAFGEWVERLAGELDYHNPAQTYSHEESLRVLVGSEDEPGELYPDAEGYPSFYGFPFVEQKTADDVVYHLYRTAFEPEEAAERESGRTAAYVRVYATVDVMDKGQISCAGVMISRYPLASDASGSSRASLPDTLVFHETFAYMRDLACRSEADLLDLYRAVRASKVGHKDDSQTP
jgi:hypothetical protein